jgi:hypothetical protein
MAEAKKKKKEKVGIKVVEAACEHILLQDRDLHPAGSFDKQKRWFPAFAYPCCDHIRRPSGKWPFSLLVHCRTAEHVAYDHDVPIQSVRSVALAIRRGNVDYLLGNLEAEAIVSAYHMLKDKPELLGTFAAALRDIRPDLVMDLWTDGKI